MEDGFVKEIRFLLIHGTIETKVISEREHQVERQGIKKNEIWH